MVWKHWIFKQISLQAFRCVSRKTHWQVNVREATLPLCLRQSFVFLVLICKSYPAVLKVGSPNHIPALPSHQQALAQATIWFTQFSVIRWLYLCVYWLSPALLAPTIRPPWDTAHKGLPYLSFLSGIALEEILSFVFQFHRPPELYSFQIPFTHSATPSISV